MKLPSSAVFLHSFPDRAEEAPPSPPVWIGALLGRFVRRSGGRTGSGISLEVIQGGAFCLASARVIDARRLAPAAFRETIAQAYRWMRRELCGRGYSHPVRLWNHIPGIHDPMGGGQDRYMVFNAGRFDALAEWFGQESFDTRIATASGVGHDGRDLVLHCLAADRAGRAVDNPRQVAPYRYSRKYGPLPPCFARATVVHPPLEGPLALVGGTASIVGEESAHQGDLERQTDETLTNLAVLLHAAAGDPAGATEDRAAALAGFRDVRVYFPDPRRLDELRSLLKDAFPGARHLEWVRADICRAELLVEIEGVAELPGTTSRAPA
jgi:chorismate lyase/3-hydroxybenzoate synthase